MAQAHTVKKAFSRETIVEMDINSPTERVWQVLGQAEHYPKWTSTILALEGKIAPGESLRLRSALDPKRTFRLKVKALEPNGRMVWGGSMGERIFALTALPEGGTRFRMSEKIGSPLFFLFAGMIPPFDEAFDRFAQDLKLESEKASR